VSTVHARAAEHQGVHVGIIPLDFASGRRQSLAVFPGFAISVAVLGFNLFGDTLRDAWDPKLRKG
jgi:hypothetical protein